MGPYLRELIDFHGQHFSKGSLKANFGDGYLMEYNPLYRSIRLSALDLGFKFSQSNYLEYQVLPLSQLESIIKTRTLPYIDNVKMLKQLVKPQLTFNFKMGDLPEPKKNYVFHESCHAVARSLRYSYFTAKKKSVLSKREEQSQAVVLALEEAFANTCELLAFAFCSDNAALAFLKHNNYQDPSKTDKVIIDKSIAQFGFRAVFFITLFSFLYSNCLYKKLDFKELKQVKLFLVTKGLVEPSEIDFDQAKKRKLLLKVFSLGLSLSLGFRLNTARFCARLYGYKQSIFKLYERDPLEVLQENPQFSELIDNLFKVIKI